MVVSWMVQWAVYAYEKYQWTLAFADKRVENWPLMKSAWPTAVLTLCYLAISIVGPKLMRHRQPFELRSVLIAYNFAMVGFNAYILVEVFTVVLLAGYNFACQPVNYTDDPLEIRMAAILWWFYISKLVEFCDTIFFILRKKFKQLTFLHVYHHSTMFCFWWVGVKWVGGGSSFIGALLNSFVHILMYGYYALAAAWPYTDFWWKRYLTVIQMVQFNIVIVLTIRGLRINCPFPRWMGYTLVCYMISFIVLFGNFWFHSYIKRMKGEDKSDEKPFYDAVSPRKNQLTVGEYDAMANGDDEKRGCNRNTQNGFMRENGTHRRKRQAASSVQSWE